MNPARILVVEDEPDMLETCAKILRHMGLQVETAVDGRVALEKLHAGAFDLALVDLRLPELDGLAFLRETRRRFPDLVVIIMTAYASIESDLQAIEAGAFDYIPKPFTVDQLEEVIARALRYLEGHRTRPPEETDDLERLHQAGIIGHDPRFLAVLRRVIQLAPSDTTVLLRGESGTGKELLARAIHRLSPRADGPFVAVDCGAIPENLLESEFFGYEKGAFTGADTRRIGLLEQAHKGTLFLDEIANLPMALQAKLLRAIQERTIRRLGGDREIPVDFRIVAATQRDLRPLVEAGRFREDLYYRIQVVEIVLPPLRDRPQDIPLLAEYFFQRLRDRFPKPVEGLARATHLVLRHYTWPGNVRELQNAIEHALAVSRGPYLQPLDLPEYILDAVRQQQEEMAFLTYHQARQIALERFETEYISRLLTHTRGNVSEAARLAGLRRTSLYKILRRYGMDPRHFRKTVPDATTDSQDTES